MKKALFLALSLVMCLGLTVPAMAVGEAKVIEGDSCTATITNIVNVITGDYLVGPDRETSAPKTVTFHVMSDEGGTITYEANPGCPYYYADGVDNYETCARSCPCYSSACPAGTACCPRQVCGRAFQRQTGCGWCAPWSYGVQDQQQPLLQNPRPGRCFRWRDAG